MSTPQFFPNKLNLVPVEKESLRNVLVDLRAAVCRGIEIIEAQCPMPDVTDNGEAFGTIFSGRLGIALMFLRLEKQANALSDSTVTGRKGDSESTLPDFRSKARPYISLQPLETTSIQPGRSSPLCSPSLGSLLTRILAGNSKSYHDLPKVSLTEDISTLRESIQIAINQDRTVIRNGHSMGVDEVLYGRSGLLWALTSIDGEVDDVESRKSLQPITEMKSELRDIIIDAGQSGAKDFADKHVTAPMAPLMWPWLNDYYGLGAMHGCTGILTILLADEASPSECLYIGPTITALCRLCISENGHLPMSIPPWQSSRSSPLVQLCHGSPGLLVLLATAKRITALRKYQTPEWDEAIRLGSERAWEEGLLSKGGGICHGIAGNAWPWLLLHETFLADEIKKSTSNIQLEEKLTADYFLSRALAFLLAARDTSPFSTDSVYRTPDNPYSLFEGLAGTICAWAEACAVITARLQLMDDQSKATPHEVFEKYDDMMRRNEILGLPGLGGFGNANGISRFLSDN